MVIKKKISLISAFPPPMGGAAKNSLKLLNDLESSGFGVYKINTSVSILSHNRAGMYHIRRMFCFVANLIKLLGNLLSGVRVLYIVPDGGLGIAYGFFYTGLAKVFGGHIVFHYRNFSYIDKRSVLLRFILFFSGEKSTHIFLDEYMQTRFCDVYGIKDTGNQLIVYNSAYLDFTKDHAFRETDRKKLVIGHLSNLCYEKGFYDFSKLIDHLNSTIGEEFIEFHIGGDPVGFEEKNLLDKLIEKNLRIPMSTIRETDCGC